MTVPNNSQSYQDWIDGVNTLLMETVGVTAQDVPADYLRLFQSGYTAMAAGLHALLYSGLYEIMEED